MFCFTSIIDRKTSSLVVGGLADDTDGLLGMLYMDESARLKVVIAQHVVNVSLSISPVDSAYHA